MPMRRLIFFFLALAPVFFSGCTRFILRNAAPSLLPEMSASFLEECDPNLARHALPSNLKLLEALLKKDPQNTEILVSLAMGFAGYSLLFVESEEPERASGFYDRARAYGLRALGDRGKILADPASGPEKLQATLDTLSEGDYRGLFWASLSWNAWISLNLDQPRALSQSASAEACLHRVLEMNPLYLHGLPHILAGVLYSARPPMLGGDPLIAKAHFEAAMKANHGKFFLTQVYFARYYAVRVQDKALFENLLNDVTAGDPQELKDACLINRVMQENAEVLKRHVEDFFF